MEVQPRTDIGLTRKRYMFCQENIERVGKGLVVSWFHLGFRLRGRSVEQVGYRVTRWEGSMEGKGWEKFDPKKKGRRSEGKTIDRGRMLVNVG